MSRLSAAFLNAAVETGKRNEMIQEETKRVALTFDARPKSEYAKSCWTD
ncbi:MAG: hypothetical protein V8S31_03455 [Lachnospiraceae bacterium]